VSDLVLYTLTSLDGATENPHRHFPETGDKHGAPVFDQKVADLEDQSGEAFGHGRRPADGHLEEWSTVHCPRRQAAGSKTATHWGFRARPSGGTKASAASHPDTNDELRAVA
jgi:hypothetical protein